DGRGARALPRPHRFRDRGSRGRPTLMSSNEREPLVIRSLEFLGGMASLGGWRPEPDLPEIAFAGRSNVGKSSLLNRLIGMHKLARASNEPGRTREVNFFDLD